MPSFLKEEDDILTEAESLDFASIPISRLQAIVNKEGPYYPAVEGSDNPYRDGYVTVPPKKPRGSYLFFQCALRSYYQSKNPQANLQSELMSALGDAWRKMNDEERAPFLHLAAEEAKQYEVQKELLEKAQKPNAVWQPIRRCEMVLDKICSDAFSEVFLEPVDTYEFPDYKDIIDQPMDLGTVRKRLESKKYQTCEQFARDVRKVRGTCENTAPHLITLLTHSTNQHRYGTTVKSTIHMDRQSGMLPITCLNNLNAHTMHGYWNSGSDIFVGIIPLPVHGSTLVAFMMVNVIRQMRKQFFVTIAMQSMD
jgi:Bromodomain/HMG (high mobility group) box